MWWCAVGAHLEGLPYNGFHFPRSDTETPAQPAPSSYTVGTWPVPIWYCSAFFFILLALGPYPFGIARPSFLYCWHLARTHLVSLGLLFYTVGTWPVPIWYRSAFFFILLALGPFPFGIDRPSFLYCWHLVRFYLVSIGLVPAVSLVYCLLRSCARCFPNLLPATLLCQPRHS